MQRYEKPPFYPLGYRNIVRGLQLSEEKELVLKVLWDWRDLTARKDDESVNYIMSDEEMVRICSRVPVTIDALEGYHYYHYYYDYYYHYYNRYYNHYYYD